ncbi:MAG: hypothetical protein VX640_15430 [Pseudomonadota bacterium]|nr:hypothetical protein [Pseudomonadota bacterium]
MATDLQNRTATSPSPSAGRNRAWRVLGATADLLSFGVVFIASAAAVVLLAIAAPFAVGVSALSGVAGKDRRRHWRAAPVA